MYYAGIDPGTHGAIAIIKNALDIYTIEVIHDMPLVTKTTASGKTRNRIDVVALNRILTNYPGLSTIIIEDVVSRGGEGTTNAFTFGHGLGSVEAVARLTKATVTMIPPQRWKAAYGLTADKGESLHLAKALTGDAEHFERKKDDGRAEAFLMALYGAENGTVEHQGERLDAYRKAEAAKPKKARKGDAPTRSGDDILADLKARVNAVKE